MNRRSRALAAAVVFAGMSMAVARPIDRSAASVPPCNADGWCRTGTMQVARYSSTATLLRNGRVLVTGGCSSVDANSLDCAGLSGNVSATAELYDPRTATWSAVAPMKTARYAHEATLLSDGRVLVSGGIGDGSSATRPILGSAEVFDPSGSGGRGSWADTLPMVAGVRSHTSTLLDPAIGGCVDLCGQVLVSTGVNAIPDPAGAGTALAQLYDPRTNRWAPTAPLVDRTRAEAATSTLMKDGQVLLAGGCCDEHNSVEIFSPVLKVWRPAAPLGFARYGAVAALLPTGAVLLASGTSVAQLPKPAELYDQPANDWTSIGQAQESVFGPGAALLPGGELLVAGGQSSAAGYPPLATAEIYGRAGVRPVGSMNAARQSTQSVPHSVHAILLSADPSTYKPDPAVCALNCGRVLVFGGSGDASADLFGPPLVVASPVVRGISPPCAPIATANTPVTVTGAGFYPSSVVKIDGVAVPSTVNSTTSIDIRAPARPAPAVAQLTVTSLGGESAPALLRYPCPPPAITALVPGSGPPEGGTRVVIRGSGLASTRAVHFGTKLVSSPCGAYGGTGAQPCIDGPSENQVIAYSPAAAAGRVHVSVDAGTGTSMPTDADFFEYRAPSRGAAPPPPSPTPFLADQTALVGPPALGHGAAGPLVTAPSGGGSGPPAPPPPHLAGGATGPAGPSLPPPAGPGSGGALLPPPAFVPVPPAGISPGIAPNGTLFPNPATTGEPEQRAAPSQVFLMVARHPESSAQPTVAGGALVVLVLGGATVCRAGALRHRRRPACGLAY